MKVTTGTCESCKLPHVRRVRVVVGKEARWLCAALCAPRWAA